MSDGRWCPQSAAGLYRPEIPGAFVGFEKNIGQGAQFRLARLVRIVHRDRAKAIRPGGGKRVQRVFEYGSFAPFRLQPLQGRTVNVRFFLAMPHRRTGEDIAKQRQHV